MQRQWRVYEATLRRELGAVGVEPDVADVALERIKPIYLRHAKPNEIPNVVSPDELLRLINDWVKQLGNGLLMEILVREIQLINLRGEVG
jgi:hypothetical protein